MREGRREGILGGICGKETVGVCVLWEEYFQECGEICLWIVRFEKRYGYWPYIFIIRV